MQAVILVGGEGSRLRPLTSDTPKPIVPLVDRPFMAYMLQWLAGHGIKEVIMCCSFRAGLVRDVLGDGSDYGVSLTYVEDPEPRGTAGAIKSAQHLIEGEFLMLNGDVLTDFDLTAQIAQHRTSSATATLGLVEVADPSAYGLVLQNNDDSVQGFLEKPTPEQINQSGLKEFFVSAGIYVLDYSVFDLIDEGRPVSIEQEIWPALVGNGLYAHRSQRGAYWMDIGTPDRYLLGSFDILMGMVHTSFSARMENGHCLAGDISDEAVVDGIVLIEKGARVEAGATIIGPAIIGAGARISSGARIVRSVVLEEATVGQDSHLENTILSPWAKVGNNCQLKGFAMVGSRATVGDNNILVSGQRVAPYKEISAGTLF